MQTKKRENALIPVFVPILFLIQNYAPFNRLIMSRLNVYFLRRTDNFQVTDVLRCKVVNISSYIQIYIVKSSFIFNIKELYTDTKPDKTTYYHDYAS